MRWLPWFVIAVALPACTTSSAVSPAVASAVLGQPAPDFSLPALDGTTHTLSQYRGKTVVLEWFNPGCPFVQYAHGSGGPLDGLAARAAADGLVWLAINSGVPGKQGHGAEVNRQAAADWKMAHPVLLDETSVAGRAYGAVTTPQMYVIDPEGRLVYRGALDNRPLGNGEGQNPVGYVANALADLKAGRPVALAETKPYGCSVKY
jgi:hypothetical protein